MLEWPRTAAIPPGSPGLLLALLVLLAAGPVRLRAEVVALEVRTRGPFADGAEFGTAGRYEELRGIVRYAVDPELAQNRVVVDLERAPRHGGRVEFSADFVLLKPVDLSRSNGCLLYDVNNRGNQVALGFFNGGGGGGPVGNGFLMRQGYTVLWSGWIGELLPGEGRLLLQSVIATDEGRDIVGPVRFEMSCDGPAKSLPLSRREGHGSYPPTERGEAEATLTWRLREKDARIPIPRPQWSLERLPIPEAAGGVAGTLGQIRLRLAGGFQPGYLYELVYQARGPLVQGLGYAAVRDLVSFLKRHRGPENPLQSGEAGAAGPAVSRAIGFGVSQSGRFLRNFLQLGFNLDEKGRKVFDALMPHVAGGGLGFFNHRFAQPTRHNAQHEEHLYPTDRFPFAYGESTDPFTRSVDSVLPRSLGSEAAPLVFHTQTSAEYWHRSGSLVHTDPLGRRDLEIPPGVRIYVFGGAQHGPASSPPSRGIGQNLANPADYRPFLRALLLALDGWARDGTAPPPSVYPTIAGGTLIDPGRYLREFPALPGVRPPEVIQRPPAADYGPVFASQGVISIEPPRILGEYTVLVPAPDALGNDRGTLLLPEVAAPLATFTGWNLRGREAGAENELLSLTGSYFPLPGTRAERQAAGDPRPSLEELYGSFEEWSRRQSGLCADLSARRLFLAEDTERAARKREEARALFAGAQAAAR